MARIVVARFHPHWRRKQQALLDAGYGHKVEDIALLDAQHLPELARLSLFLLLAGCVFFAVLTVIALYIQTGRFTSTVTFGGIVLVIVVNLLGYLVVLPLHEAIHGLAFAFWGGRPTFGARLPLALFCGAKQQLFRRNQYLVIGLAPLVVITGAGIVLTLLQPSLAVYTLLALAGNISGACGDLLVATRLLSLSSAVLIEDTEVGYSAWEMSV